jgi:spore coat protein H
MHRSIKVKTDLFGGEGDWDGLETINFNSGGRDYSRTREALAFAVFRLAGVPASRTAYAEVRYTVPGLHDRAYGGLFTVIENVNKAFLKQALPPGTGLLMKPERMSGGVGYYGENWANYTPYYRPERDATPAEAQRVMEFARLVNVAPAAEFRARIGSYLDVDEFMRFLAVHALIHARDSFLSGRHNYFIYLDPKDNLFRFSPWDEDGAMNGGQGGRGGTGTFGIDLLWPWSASSPLAQRLLDEPDFRNRYQAVVRDIVAKVFNQEKLMPLVDQLEALVDKPLGLEETAMALRGESDRPSGNSPRYFLADRFLQVEAQMAAWPKAP